MARKRQQRRTASRSSGSPEDRVIDAALRLAETKGWGNAGLPQIAAAAGLSLAALYALFPSRAAIIGAFMRRIDRATLEGVDPEARDGSVRDRLFDLYMRRFDVLAPHKRAVAALAGDLARRPLAALCLARRLTRSVAWMAAAAGVDTTGPAGALRVKALTALYLCVLRTWLGDESSDHAKTMAALDQGLKRAEMLAQSFPFGRARSRPA